MAGTNKKVTVNVQADTKHFQVHMQQAGKSTKAFRQETQRLHGQGRLLSNTFQKAANAAAVFHGPLGGISGRLSAMATSFRILNPLVIAGGAAFSGLALGMKSGLTTAIETEHQMARLAAVVKATGNASGFTAEQLDTMSRNLAMNTLASTEGVRTAAAALATFSTISGDAFEKTLGLGQDIAEVMGTDVKSATMQLAKALDAPLLGLNSLRRSGVSFTEAEREKIKVLMRSGEIFKAQGVILDAVASQLENVGVLVASETVVGAWDTLGQEVKEFWEGLAKAFGWAEKTQTVLNKVIELARGGKKALGEVDEEFLNQEELEKRFKKYQELVKGANFNEMNSRASDTGGMFRDDSQKGTYDRNKAMALKYLAEINRRKQEAAEASEAAETAELLKGQKLRESIREAGKKRQVAFDKIIDQERKKQASSGQFGAKQEGQVAEEEARYQAAVAAYDRRIEMIREKEGIIVQLEEEFATTREMMRAEHVARHNEAIGEENKEANKNLKTNLDHALSWEELYNKNRTEGYMSAAESAQSAFSTISGVMKEGSKAQMSMLVMEKAMANVRAAIAIQVAMAEALKVPWPANIAAMAQVAAIGATIIANIASMQTSVKGRASGGPVTPGGRYMVGEHGPEILQMGTGSGNVVKNEDISPKVNVTIVESGERAGTVEQEGNDIQVFVAAAMQHLNDEMSAGRGLFANMENRYGLSR